ncbi:hypothetical protein J057_18695 [Marinobacter nanhaiticus D15-8W]|uniref:Uncharacterized protein n=1 Tax=Marinobacter nanhaiticus D15-8W TaxID=626887 RepID=N6WXA2_9GAMM|nr:hypothetical protein J057_18695 [Marinobacter nanhaiticus D15-8W]
MCSPSQWRAYYGFVADVSIDSGICIFTIVKPDQAANDLLRIGALKVIQGVFFFGDLVAIERQMS